jgi:hypothetical protein
VKTLLLTAAFALTMSGHALADDLTLDGYAMDLYNAEVAKCHTKGEHAEEMAALNHKTEAEQNSAADDAVNDCIKELNTRHWTADFDSWKVHTR